MPRAISCRSLAIGLALCALGLGSLRLADAQTFSDPFAYCARIKTEDAPASGFTPSPVPAGLLPYLAPLFNLKDGDPLKPELFYWRCMGGAVFVCAVGANLPCAAKADRATRNRGADAYCRDNPNAAIVPAAATGHDTIYAWSCRAGRAIRGAAVAKLDPRGYRTDLWRRVSP